MTRSNQLARCAAPLGVTVFVVATIAVSGSHADPASQDDTPSSPIIVELFTSQGCSSCPPADRLLSRLGDSAEVIPLAYHVDYWNYIGWRDPFSSAAWSERQRRYAQVLASRRVYTPQLVVAGRHDCVGSQAAEVDRLLAGARRQPSRGRVAMTVRPASSGVLEVEIRAEVLRAPGSRQLDLMLAVVESDLETQVTRGENAHRTLHNDHVVRRLDKVLTLEAEAGQNESLRLRLELDPVWNRERLRLVAFLQDPESLAIHGAGAWHLTGTVS